MGLLKNRRSVRGMPTSPIIPDENGLSGTSYMLEPILGKGNGGFIITRRHLLRDRVGRRGRESMRLSETREHIRAGESRDVPWFGRVEGD